MTLQSGAHGLFRRLRYHSEAARWLYKLVALTASQAVADLNAIFGSDLEVEKSGRANKFEL